MKTAGRRGRPRAQTTLSGPRRTAAGARAVAARTTRLDRRLNAALVRPAVEQAPATRIKLGVSCDRGRSPPQAAAPPSIASRYSGRLQATWTASSTPAGRHEAAMPPSRSSGLLHRAERRRRPPPGGQVLADVALQVQDADEGVCSRHPPPPGRRGRTPSCALVQPADRLAEPPRYLGHGAAIPEVRRRLHDGGRLIRAGVRRFASRSLTPRTRPPPRAAITNARLARRRDAAGTEQRDRELAGVVDLLDQADRAPAPWPSRTAPRHRPA